MQVGDDRGGRLAEGDLVTEPGEGLGDLQLGVGQIEAELRVGVDRPSQLDGLVLQTAGGGDEVGSEGGGSHGPSLPYRRGRGQGR